MNHAPPEYITEEIPLPDEMAPREPAPIDYSYLDALNQEQREAVETLDGPVLVLAGAGTGKTRALTTRIAHLIHTQKAFPGQILSVTFTNKAAAEMKERVEALLQPNDTFLRGGDSQAEAIHTKQADSSDGSCRSARENSSANATVAGMWLGTFHSICVRMLRRHAERLGYPNNFTILDDDDQIRLIKQLLSEANLDPKVVPPKMVQAIIQRWKDKGLTPEKAKSHVAHEDAQALMLYTRYQERMKTIGAMDFGDLILHCLTLFQECPDVLQEFHRRFRYILVDEYQDTNTAQYLWLRLLAMESHNICCVGDDDQSIYGWRGAEVGNILKFEKDFPEAKTIRLERNYRSTGHILGAASELITKNSERLGKTLWTEDADGEFVRIKSTWDDAEEARFVGEEVESYQRDKISLEEMAILVRAGYQTRAFEERFITLGIPYRVIGGLRFYERMEIRDVVGYLRVIAQPNDDLALERIVNTPKRGIGKSTIEKLHGYARQHNCSLYAAMAVGCGYNDDFLRGAEGDAAIQPEQEASTNGSLRFAREKSHEPFITGKAAKTLHLLMSQFERWRSMATDTETAELADLILEESGYRAMWKADKSPEANGRLENLKELLRALEEFPTLNEFLEHVGLVTQGTEDKSQAMISLMTLHAAKGLEFQVVFLTGWEEGLFPSQRSMDEKGTAGLEEERRLAYVGITRARLFCTICHAANRRIYGQWQSSIPSRFIGELPEAHIENIDGPLHYQSAGPKPFQREINDIFAAVQEDHSSANKGHHKGAQVFHAKFGNGVIIAVDGDHLTIAFKHAGKKKVMCDYVELA